MHKNSRGLLGLKIKVGPKQRIFALNRSVGGEQRSDRGVELYCKEEPLFIIDATTLNITNKWNEIPAWICFGFRYIPSQQCSNWYWLLKAVGIQSCPFHITAGDWPLFLYRVQLPPLLSPPPHTPTWFVLFKLKLTRSTENTFHFVFANLFVWFYGKLKVLSLG